MSTAYGHRDTSYYVSDTSPVYAYSFEFSGLVSSYPKGDNQIRRIASRERIAVGLVRSVVLAKHLGVEKLKAIRRSYERYHLAEATVHRNAFKLLLKQTNNRIPDDSEVWKMFQSIRYQMPLFPYRMQMVTLWDKSTNRRVLQASAHQDIANSVYCAEKMRVGNKKWILDDVAHPDSIFDYCTTWTISLIDSGYIPWKCLLGLVMETVRTFLAEWVSANEGEPEWEPEMPTECIQVNTGETVVRRRNLTWICQRELQRKVAKMSRTEGYFRGNACLIMLFILGFPLLQTDNVQGGEIGGQGSQDEAREASISFSSNRHCSISLGDVQRAWTPLAPQHISLLIQIDETNRTLSLRLENDSGDARFS